MKNLVVVHQSNIASQIAWEKNNNCWANLETKQHKRTLKPKSRIVNDGY
jgi:hypothetical protein